MGATALTALGSFAGPAGAFIGALGGQALGSLFGGGTPHPASVFGVAKGFDESGNLTAPNFHLNIQTLKPQKLFSLKLQERLTRLKVPQGLILVRLTI